MEEAELSTLRKETGEVSFRRIGLAFKEKQMIKRAMKNEFIGSGPWSKVTMVSKNILVYINCNTWTYKLKMCWGMFEQCKYIVFTSPKKVTLILQTLYEDLYLK